MRAPVMQCEHKDWSGRCPDAAAWIVDVRTPFGREESHWCREHLGHHLDDVSVPGQVVYSAIRVSEDPTP